MKIVDFLATKYPNIHFRPGETYYWSPSEKTVFYKQKNNSIESTWTILHETSHALLGHSSYNSDFELVQLEAEAWEKAKELTKELNRISSLSRISVDEDHVQDCLDSYRDWLHKRSLCPNCKLSSAQTNPNTYTCIFCHNKWTVTTERFCRPYRKRNRRSHQEP